MLWAWHDGFWLQLSNPSDREDDWWETHHQYRTSQGRAAPTLWWRRDPFRPSSHTHQTQPKGRDEDSTARWSGLETQVWDTAEHTPGAPISAGAAAASPLLSALGGLQTPSSVPKATGCYLANTPQVQKTISDKLTCPCTLWKSLSRTSNNKSDRNNKLVFIPAAFETFINFLLWLLQPKTMLSCMWVGWLNFALTTLQTHTPRPLRTTINPTILGDNPTYNKIPPTSGCTPS